MHVGDKVKFIRSTEEGVVTKILSETMVEVEIQDGFTLPVHKKEVVVVSQKEAKIFGSENDSKSNVYSKQIISEKGLYVAFSGKDNELACYFVNNTDYEVILAFYEEKSGSILSVCSNKIEPKEYILLKNISMQHFESWPVFIFKYLKFMPESSKQEDWVTHKMKFKIQGFRETLADAPLLNRKAYVFQIDQAPNTQVIKEKIEQKKEVHPVSKIVKPSSQVDLHIEKLRTDHMLIGNSDKMKIQVEVFENSLANALASDMEEITFIHGVGNGTLRNAIHKLLAKNKNIKFFKDAQKDKFGYGATYVKLK
ncbi:MAG: Smr/MutS family protein [Cytophagales bacterium]